MPATDTERAGKARDHWSQLRSRKDAEEALRHVTRMLALGKLTEGQARLALDNINRLFPPPKEAAAAAAPAARKAAPPKMATDIDPDDFLQRLVDLASAEVSRLQQKHKANSPPCAHCGGGGQLDRNERGFITNTLRETRQVAFGARRLLNDRHLRKLSEGSLGELQKAIDGEKEWLPDVD